ncbi:drug resistance transporter, EmrB/QacA subfamily [Selenomonas ruminantium]|uniref:Drug resistance transporter, EmrB/QacA subfamily n=1 Tax=Selenomonas ruminantium TaxID=971 RepID=A0A1M6SSU5_SELRU|nr:MFS transporter [Selenomonas ruminantium]SHK47804.1 drug resistance transporter, EmrB/QacA subfamily [Selenomonas ruminantium]
MERRILFTIMLTSFLTPFAGSALNLALPSLGEAYGASPAALGWVLGSFLLAAIVVLLPFGKLADRYGKRRFFIMGNGIFALTSLLAAFAPNLPLLLAARAAQGIGSAMTFATSMSILTLVIPKERRGWAMGWNVAVVYTGLTLGPVAGGFLNYYYGWPSIFIVLAMIGGTAFLAARRFLQEEWYEDTSPHWDKKGAVLYGGAILLIIYGLSQLNSQPLAPGLLLGGLVLFFLFCRYELRQENPLLPITLLQGNLPFSLSCLAALLNYCGTFAASFLLSLYLQSILGMTSRSAGLILLSQPIIMALLSPLMGKLSDKYAPTKLAALGMAVISAGLAGFALTIHNLALWLMIPMLIITGTGFALFAAPNNNAIMSAVEKKHYGLAASLLSSTRLVGQVLSVALMNLILSLSWDGLSLQETLLQNLQLALLFFALLSGLGVIPAKVRQ